jgi:hypothetical protein
MHREFWEAGFRVFGIYGARPDGKCACGNPLCNEKALLKHPRVANWQHTPDWSEEQLETMEMMGHFDTGYGVLCKGLLVIDIDARNGGIQSYERLLADHPAVSGAEMIVNTGSGGGSRHLYFKAPVGKALVVKLKEYPGIDFKSGASFVIGPGSLHASGNRYEAVLGRPEDIDDAPEALLAALAVPERHRAELDGKTVDVSHSDLASMVAAIPGYDDYEVWVRVGMALHHASDGTALDVWDRWSSQSSKYEADAMPKKWHSFGKSANPVTLGTLVHYAEANGWRAPVTFTPTVEFDYVEPTEEKGISTDGVDLLRPPGLVGELARWIEGQARRPRERLSSFAAIQAMGNIAGLKYTDDKDKATTNLFTFNVAGSGTGKEAIQDAIKEVHRVCGIAPATHGTIKSEQEIVRNLIRHQAAFYIADEVGSLLTKIANAKKKGGAVYLDGVIGQLMSAYSKANGFMLLSGDVRDAVKAEMLKELARLDKRMEEKPSPVIQSRIDSVNHQLRTIDNGLERPFLSVAGYTTNTDFDNLVDVEQATNGFIARSLICVELETAPATKKGFRPQPMSEGLKMALQQIAMGGHFDAMQGEWSRVEHYGPKVVIPTTPEGTAMLDRVIDEFDRMAEEHKSITGLEALAMRGYEMVTKVSLILAIPEGVRTQEHVRWAYKLVRQNIETKMRLVTSNDRAKDDPFTAMRSKIANLINREDGETMGVIVNKMRGFKKPDIEAVLQRMVNQGAAEVKESIHKYNKVVVKRYKLVDG